jgi:phosphoenolpyruvate synthase/pyruvate phosphate dikinase
VKALGTALRKHGVLNDPMDVFFAPYATLDAAVTSNDPLEWQRLGEAVRLEKQAYDRHRRETPVWEWGVPAVAVATHDSILTGLPGSPGIACGPVFKVLGSEDFGKFPKGAVLVARTTNPAWTPLFYKAAAVITESGGPLSHGAVTAREIGLPAVMSVRTALVDLTNGQKVTVDGTTGRVHPEKTR